MPGPRRQPTALRLLRGNPGKRKINRLEPQPPPLETVCPPELVSPVAQAEWTRVAAGLIASGQVTTVDRALLIGYCQKWAQWQALEEAAAAHPFILKGPQGKPIPNPALNLAFKAFNLLIRASAELGMTPSARSRVSVAAPASTPVSKWAGVLK
jgi:P27 family predicted phage terminase small subunit